MRKKFFGSLMLMGWAISNVSAVDFSTFGHVGTAYSFGINQSIDGQKPWFGGFTGRVGFELGMGPVSVGLGVAGALPYGIKPDGDYRNHIQHGVFTDPRDVKWYNWLSDAYLRVDTRMFSIVGGRYDLTKFFSGKDGKAHTGVDWISGQNEGVSFKLDTRYFAWWGIYSYETMNFGARTPNRLGSDLMGFHQYEKSGHLISTGFDINIKEMIYIDPFVTYNIDQKYLQAGGKVQAEFGKGAFKSKTTLRGMYQHRDYYNSNTFLGWGDQEFLISNLFKFGGGGYYVGKEDGIMYFSDNTRFYGKTFGGGINYFAGGSGVWYVFAGIEHKFFNFDFIYADGDYKEISAIAQVNLFKNQWVDLGVGGGWIRSSSYYGQKEDGSYHIGTQDRGVAFVKLSF